MENASKALLIAGAILLAILLISLGIMIFTQAQDTVNNSGMSQAEIQAFNNKFLKYEGEMRGATVRQLINEVVANNADESTPTITATLNGTTIASSTLSGSSSGINSKNKYKVSLGYGNKGYVSTITIVTSGS